jgi:hypothetical protein
LVALGDGEGGLGLGDDLTGRVMHYHLVATPILCLIEGRVGSIQGSGQDFMDLGVHDPGTGGERRQTSNSDGGT